MKLAIINNETKIVENVIVPPVGATVWVVPNGYDALETEVAEIGDTWDGEKFVKPPVPEEN